MGLSQQTKINTDIRKRPSNPEQENSVEQNTTPEQNNSPEQNQIDEMTSAMNDAVEYAEGSSGIKGLFGKVRHAIGKGLSKGWDKTKMHARNAWSDVTLAYFATKEARKYRHEEAKRDKLIAKAEAAGLIVERDPNDLEGLKNHIDLNDLAYRKNKSKIGTNTPVVDEENITAEPIVEQQETAQENEQTEVAQKKQPEVTSETEERVLDENVVPEVTEPFRSADQAYYRSIIDLSNYLQDLIKKSYNEVDGKASLKRNPEVLANEIIAAAESIKSGSTQYVTHRREFEVHPEINVDDARELPDVPTETESVEDNEKE